MAETLNWEPVGKTDPKWESVGLNWEPVGKEERAKPGSLSYILQGAPAAFEAAGRVGFGMAGATAGALVGGAEALLGNDPAPAADIIRNRMAAGAEQLTPSQTAFAPTKSFDEAIMHGMEGAREIMGSGVEGMERGRAAITGQEPATAAARTLGEFAFDAPAAIAPATMALRGVRRPPKPQEPSPLPKEADPKAIVDQHLGRETGPELRESAYEVPETRLPVEESTAEAIRRFQERGGEVREGQVITEAERVSRAVREFQQRGASPDTPTLPPRGQTGAIGHLDRLSALDRDLLRYEAELKEAVRREEKDTVKYFREAIEETKTLMEDLRTKYEEAPPIDPFKGPGRRQAGALVFEGTESTRIRQAFNFIKERWPRFAEIKDITVVDNAKFAKDLADKGFSPKERNWILGYWDHGTNKVVVTDRLGQFDTGNMIDLMAHELRHAFDAPRKPWRQNREYWGNPKGELTKEQYSKIPAEAKAIAAGAAATNRLYSGALPRGPGKRQSGMILSRGQAEEVKPRTKFEEEEGLPTGGGLSLPDTKSPLMDRVIETIEIGKDLNVKAGTPSKVELPNDIGVLGKYGLTAEHISKFYSQNPLIKRVVDGVSEITARYGNLKEDLMKGSELLGKGGISALKYIKRGRTGFTSIADNLNKTDYIALQKAWLEFDNSPLLREANLEYPTREMLAERGYNQKTIDAYLAEAQYMKAIYTLINDARAKSGKAPIAFLPGHFPHTYKGNTGIKIIRKVMEDGVAKDVTVGYTRTTGSQKQINKIMSTLMADIQKKLSDENHPPADLRAEQARTDKPGNLSDVLDAFETVQEIYSHSDKPFVQLIKKVLDNRVSSMEQQFLQAALHRTGLPGWIGYTGVTQKNVNQIRQARTNYINSAIDYARSQEILSMMNEIDPVSWREISSKLPNTAHYVERFVEVARERVPLNEADRAVFDVIDKLFRGRLGYRAPLAGAQGARGFFSVMDLGWSVAYHTANLFQPTVYGPAALLRESNRIGKGDIASSIIQGELGFVRPTLKDKRAMEYAAKHKIITPRLMEEIDFLYRESQNKGSQFVNEMITGRRGSELNEASGRARMYLQAYYYYESAGFNPFQSMRAAGKLVNDVMVDYGRTGQNLWLSNNPFGALAGKMVAPYAQFQFSHWGHIALALQAIKKNPASARAWLPFIELQAAGLLFAGVRGITGFAAAEAIWEAYNQLYEAASGEKRKWTSLRSMLMESGANDVAMFGAVSAATGQDIGSSMAAPELTGMVNFRQVQGAYDIITNTFTAFGKILLNKNIPDSEKYKALKAITPSRFHGYLETAFQTDSGIVGDPSNRMRGQFHRTPGSEQMRIITNKRTTSEERERLISRTMMDESRKGRERKGDIVELAADALDEGESPSPELLRRAQEEGYKPSDFREAVKTLRRERERTRVQKFLQGKEATRQREMMRRRFQELTDDAEFEAYR